MSLRPIQGFLLNKGEKTPQIFMYNEVELELVENVKCIELIINVNGSVKLAITELTPGF